MERVIIYGLSKAGVEIAELLVESGFPVTVAAQEGYAAPSLEAKKIPIIRANLNDFTFLGTLHLHAAQAIILSSDDELFNLQASLHAIECNPDIKVIIRLFNLNLASKLEESVKQFKVLSVSQVASPTFTMSALLEAPLFSFKTGNGRNHSNMAVFYTLKATHGFYGRSLEEVEKGHSLKIIAVNDVIFPSGQTHINKDDELMVFSSFSLAHQLCGLSCHGRCRRKEKRKKEKKRTFFFLFNTDRLFLTTLFCLALIALSSIAYFHIADHLSLIDSVYFVVTVMTTVGFGDINLKDSSSLSKLVGMVLMLSGVTLFTILFAFVTDSLLKKRMELVMGKKELRMRNHVILCGVGDVGIRVLEDLLSLGKRVVVIEKDPEARFLPFLKRRHIPLIISDASLEDTLIYANIKDAASLVCATDDDIKNLEIGLNAKTLNTRLRVVLRIYDKDFAEKIQKNFNIHAALSSSFLAAPAFAFAALDHPVIQVISYKGHRLLIKEKKVSALPSLQEQNAVMARREHTIVLATVTREGILTVGEPLEGTAATGDTLIHVTAIGDGPQPSSGSCTQAVSL